MEGQRVLLFSRKDLVYTIILWLTSNKYYVYYVWHAPLIETQFPSVVAIVNALNMKPYPVCVLAASKSRTVASLLATNTSVNAVQSVVPPIGTVALTNPSTEKLRDS